MTDEKRDAAIDAVNDCYDAINGAQQWAWDLQRAFNWNEYGYRLAEDLQYHLRLAEQILADLGDRLEGVDEDEDSDEE